MGDAAHDFGVEVGGDDGELADEFTVNAVPDSTECAGEGFARPVSLAMPHSGADVSQVPCSQLRCACLYAQNDA